MIIIIAFLALMFGFIFGYVIAALLNTANKEYYVPEPQKISDSHNLKHHCIKLDFPKDYFCSDSEKEVKEVITQWVLAKLEPLIIRNLKIERNPHKMRYEATVNIWTED